ncbi:AIR synthase family protein [Clostridium cellulovorans]|uniref:AIR synthase related protein domain protein n=1 Tax=Clostridium cellulovorans (strain ATCC 35296 / DSM 3052 / OCM 3 / 743B) TaxID=573061 RepID=D9SVK7_CLOC7|nr:AIR synthase family protein [Clostridium cellulovorans]ADL51131.1 AIR synthase related protein domain protein [Clostridium cellulovorans 743B]
MEVGKLDWEDLKGIIEGNRTVEREDVRIRSGIGEDCSVINFGDYEAVLSTDPITGAANNIGKIAVHINANDIGSCGVEVIGLLVTILAPTTATLEDIREVMREINEECTKLNIEILGGHTEVTDAVNRMVVSCTALGKGKKGEAVATSSARSGDDLIVTKDLCLEGTSIVVNDYYERIKSILTEEEVLEAKGYSDKLSVVKEGKVASKFGVNSMHDITEGGVLGAAFEIAVASGKGFELYKDNLPITEITKKIAKELNIDPLRFISSGSLLISCDNGNALVKTLEENGIKASIIGKIIDKGKFIVDSNGKSIVSPPTKDELFKL